MGRSRERDKNKKTDSSTSQEKSGSRRDKKKRKKHSARGSDSSIKRSSGSSRSRKDRKSSRSRRTSADNGSPSESSRSSSRSSRSSSRRSSKSSSRRSSKSSSRRSSRSSSRRSSRSSSRRSSRSSSVSRRRESKKPGSGAIQPPTSAKPPPVSVIRHMIAVETRTAYEKFFGQRRARGSHHEPLPAGDNKKLAVCIIVTVLILVLGGLVGSIVLLREKDGRNATISTPTPENITTPKTPGSTTIICTPNPPEPKDPIKTGHYCRDCVGNSQSKCVGCCAKYFTKEPDKRTACFGACRNLGSIG